VEQKSHNVEVKIWLRSKEHQKYWRLARSSYSTQHSSTGSVVTISE